MGIYDRDYVFQQPARRGLGGLSVNAWLILINCVVFVAGALVLKQGVPVFLGASINVPHQGEVIPVGPYLLEDGSIATPAEQRAVERPKGRPNVLFRAIADVSTKQPVPGHAEYLVHPVLSAYGHFSTHLAVFGLEVWRLLTFQFLHAGVLHLAMNMLGLYVFGGMVEQYLGSKRYLAFYLTCGIAGGLAYLALNLLGTICGSMGWNHVPLLLYNQSTTPLVGASAGVFGIILACAYISPHSIVQLAFPPIPMKLRTMAFLYVGIAVFTVIVRGRNAGGEVAHLGGALAGFVLIRRSHLLYDFFDVFTDSRKARGAAKPAPPFRSRPVSPAEDAEVDRILAKVRASGVHSLTEGEKGTLERMREHMNDPRGGA